MFPARILPVAGMPSPVRICQPGSPSATRVWSAGKRQRNYPARRQELGALPGAPAACAGLAACARLMARRPWVPHNISAVNSVSLPELTRTGTHARESRQAVTRNAVKLNVVARKKSFTEQAAEYSTLAFVLPASTFVGWLLGHLLDKGLGTGYLNIVGLLLGIVGGFVQLIRQVLRDTHDNDG